MCLRVKQWQNYFDSIPCLTSQSWQFQVVHLRMCHDEGKLLVLNVELEQCPAPDDLEGGQDDLVDVDVADQDVSGNFPDVPEEAEVQVPILEPGQLQVAVDVGAVRVPVSEIAVVMVPVIDGGQTAVCTDAN